MSVPTKLTKLTIPERHLDGFAIIAALDDVQAQALVRALDSARVTSPIAFLQQATVPNIDRDGLKKIFETLSALYLLRWRDNLDIPAFIDAVLAAMQRSGDARLVVADENRFRTILAKVLSSTEFATRAKAENLGGDFQRVLYSARILTDLRPVFAESAEAPPLGVIVVHTLKLAYHTHDWRHEDIYVALSEDDLRDLQVSVTRAIQKSETLQAQLRETGLTYIQSPTAMNHE